MRSTSDDQPPSDSSSRYAISFDTLFSSSPLSIRGTPDPPPPLTPTLRGLATPVVSYAPLPRPAPPSPLTLLHTPRPSGPTPARRQRHQTNPKRRPNRWHRTSHSPHSTTARCTGSSPARLRPPRPPRPTHIIGLPCTRHGRKKQLMTLTDDGLLRCRRDSLDSTWAAEPMIQRVSSSPTGLGLEWGR